MYSILYRCKRIYRRTRIYRGGGVQCNDKTTLMWAQTRRYNIITSRGGLWGRNSIKKKKNRTRKNVRLRFFFFKSGRTKGTTNRPNTNYNNDDDDDYDDNNNDKYNKIQYPHAAAAAIYYDTRVTSMCVRRDQSPLSPLTR